MVFSPSNAPTRTKSARAPQPLSAAACARSLAALEAGADAADEVEQPEALRLRVRLALGDGQRVACAVEVAEGAAQPTRVALPPVDDVEAWM